MKIPYFSYKTSAIFLDDNVLFLESVEDLFGKFFPMITMSNINDLYALINKPVDDIQSVIRHAESDHVQGCSIAIDLSILYKHIFQHAQTSPVSVVFLDYSMPQGNGIDVSRLIKNKEIKRVLLTGEANMRQGVEALNEHFIDAYIHKSLFDLEASIPKLFETLSKSYVSSQNQYIEDFFLTNHDISKVYNDPVLINKYYKICEQNGFIAHCIYDPQGSQIFRFDTHDVLLNVYSQKEFTETFQTIIDRDDKKYIDILRENPSYILDYKRVGDLTFPHINNFESYMTKEFVKLENADFYMTVSKLDHHIV